MEIKCTPQELKELLKKETPVVLASDVETNVIKNIGNEEKIQITPL